MKLITLNALKIKSYIFCFAIISMFGTGTKVFGETTSFFNQNTITQAVIYGDSFLDICGFEVDLTANMPENDDEIGYWSVIQGAAQIEPANEYGNEINAIVDYGTNILRWTIENDGDYSFAEVTIQNNLVPINIGADQVLCVSTFPLIGTPIPEGYIGLWTFVLVPGGALNAIILNPTMANTEIMSMDFGKMGFIWTLTHIETGCQSSDTVYITNAMPSLAIAGPDQFITNSFTTMDAVYPVFGIGAWRLIMGGATFSDIYDPKAEVTDIFIGINIFEWSVSSDLCYTLDQVIIHRTLPPFAGDDATICSDTYQLDANEVPNAVGTWTVIQGSGLFSDYQDPKATVTELAFGVNIFEWTICYSEGTCESDRVTITNDTPHPVYAGPFQQILVPLTQMQATPVINGIGTWQLVSGNSNISDINDPNATVYDITPGANVWRWYVTSEFCAAYDYVTIHRNGSAIFAGYDVAICSDTYQLDANEIPNTVGTWTVIQGSGHFSDIHDPKATVIGLARGENIFEWTVCFTEDICESDRVTITNDTPSLAIAGPNQFITNPFTTMDAAYPEIGIGTWQLILGGATISDIHDPKAEITNINVGENIFRWTVDSELCSTFDEVVISYSPETDIKEISIISDFNIFPNPATDRLKIIRTTSATAFIEIFTSAGSLVHTFEIEDLEVEIDVSNFVSGVYHIRLTDVYGGITKGFVKK